MDPLIQTLSAQPVPLLLLAAGAVGLLLAGFASLAARLRLGRAMRIGLGLAGLALLTLGVLVTLHAPAPSAPSSLPSETPAAPRADAPAAATEQAPPAGEDVEGLRVELRALEAKNEALKQELERLEAANAEAQRRLEATEAR